MKEGRKEIELRLTCDLGLESRELNVEKSRHHGVNSH